LRIGDQFKYQRETIFVTGRTTLKNIITNAAVYMVTDAEIIPLPRTIQLADVMRALMILGKKRYNFDVEGDVFLFNGLDEIEYLHHKKGGNIGFDTTNNDISLQSDQFGEWFGKVIGVEI
jgi:hypothetical protein